MDSWTPENQRRSSYSSGNYASSRAVPGRYAQKNKRPKSSSLENSSQSSYWVEKSSSLDQGRRNQSLSNQKQKNYESDSYEKACQIARERLQKVYFSGNRTYGSRVLVSKEKNPHPSNSHKFDNRSLGMAESRSVMSRERASRDYIQRGHGSGDYGLRENESWNRSRRYQENKKHSSSDYLTSNRSQRRRGREGYSLSERESSDYSSGYYEGREYSEKPRLQRIRASRRGGYGNGSSSRGKVNGGGRRKKIIFLLGFAAIILLLCFVVSSLVRSCSASKNQDSSVQQNIAQNTSQNSNETVSISPNQMKEASFGTKEENPNLTINEEAIRKALGNDPQVELEKLIKLSKDEPQSYRYVAQFPDYYSSEKAGSCGNETKQGGAPLLIQWDQRWGYSSYCNSAFGLAGCGPTSMAMVYQGLTGKTDLSPYDMGQIAQKDGYMLQYEGTADGFFTEEGARLGVTCANLSVDKQSLINALKNGSLIICNVGPGDFTERGHFIVLAGLDEKEQLIVNDPYSLERSAKRWDVSTVIAQTKALYQYSL